jgi:hypothetical protein
LYITDKPVCSTNPQPDCDRVGAELHLRLPLVAAPRFATEGTAGAPQFVEGNAARSRLALGLALLAAATYEGVLHAVEIFVEAWASARIAAVVGGYGANDVSAEHRSSN